MSKTVVFDFDGVIHSYISGWQGITVANDPPTEGIKDAITRIRDDGYNVVVVSSRCAESDGLETVVNYLASNEIVVDAVLAHKPPAIVYIDDRAICFDGKPGTLLDQIREFEPWYKKETQIYD